MKPPPSTPSRSRTEFWSTPTAPAVDRGSQARKMRAEVFRQMLKTRGWKYRLFLRQLKLFKYLAFAPTRGTFLESYYVLMRYLDDVADGDLPLPDGQPDAVAFLEDKIRFARAPADPRDRVEHMLVWCNAIASRFGADFTPETLDILHSLLFDARRRGTLQVFARDELAEHFHRMDIRGTVRATLKVFRDDPDKHTLLEPLGMASRYQFDIEDIADDLAAGYVNISREEAGELGITRAHLLDPESPEIGRWLGKHAREGLDLLKRHRDMLDAHPRTFSFLERLAFRMVYERPARDVFERTLRQHPLP